jgi:hypothetical protein
LIVGKKVFVWESGKCGFGLIDRRARARAGHGGARRREGIIGDQAGEV